MNWLIPEDVCNGTPVELMDWSELPLVLGPIGAVILLLIGGERYLKWHRRKSRTRWMAPVPKPTTREIKAHADKVLDLETRAAEVPHTETKPEDVSDEEIDEWARGDG